MIERHPGADIAIIKAIDDNDEKTKEKFGIISIPSPKNPSILTN